MLNALFGVASGLETSFITQLVAPNLAPKTEQHRNRTVHFIGSIRKVAFGLVDRILNQRSPSSEL